MKSRLKQAPALLLLSILVAAAVPACSDGDTQSSSGEPADAGTDAAALVLRIDPPMATATLALDGSTSDKIQFRVFAAEPGQMETEVTTQAALNVASSAMASIDSGGSIGFKGVGGKTQIIALYKNQTATADLSVLLKGDIFGAGIDPVTKDTFDSAPADSDPANAPVVEYPEDQAVLPSNLPPIEAQWTQASDNNIYRVRLKSPDVLDMSFYTSAREMLFPADMWKKAAASAPDMPVEMVVEALGTSKTLRTSAPKTITIASDGIDESAIYVWQSSTGSFRVLDIIKGTDIPLPNNSPALANGQPCSGCHRISRDGKRFAYSYSGSNFQIGTLAYDPAQQSYISKIAPTFGIRGTYAAFNPLEDTTKAAMLLTVPDDVPQNTPGSVRLYLVNPETNALVPSNLNEITASLDPMIGRDTLMPDWSPAGDFVVFTAHDNTKNYVRLLGDDVVLGSIIESSVQYSSKDGSFVFGAPKVLAAPPAGADADTGENNVLPAISPDGSAVAFTRANGYWSIKTQQSLINLSGRIAIVRRSDQQVVELSAASNGPNGVWSSTWPQWAPTLGQKYAWLAYASERPYGHRLTPQNSTCSLVQGQKQCKQLWITAIDLNALATGTGDPSRGTFWIPGQSITAQYVSPQWTKAVLPVPQ